MKDDGDIKKNSEDENTILKIVSDASDECILSFKESVSVETVLNALMTALYSVSIGLEENDYDFALLAAEEYLAFVKRKTSKAKARKRNKASLKLL